MLGKFQARRRAAENRIELRRRFLAHTLQQICLKTLRTPTATYLRGSASGCPGSNRDFKGLHATLQTLSLLPCVLLFSIPCPLNYDGE